MQNAKEERNNIFFILFFHEILRLRMWFCIFWFELNDSKSSSIVEQKKKKKNCAMHTRTEKMFKNLSECREIYQGVKHGQSKRQQWATEIGNEKSKWKWKSAASKMRQKNCEIFFVFFRIWVSYVCCKHNMVCVGSEEKKHT